ncbi:MAG: glycosyltransferase [Nocardioidaceae bacterium]
MRVLCVNDRPPGGASGTEVHLQLLVDGLRAAGDEVEVFAGAPRSGVGRLADTWDPRARRALEQRVAEFGPDVLHFHNIVRELSVAVLGAAPAVPRVLTVHDGRLLGDADGQGRLLRLWQGRLRAPLDARAARRTGTVLAVSGPLRDRLAAAGFRDVRHAWSWAPAPAVTAPPAASRDLAFVGRLDRDKGADLLAEAFLAADRPGTRLLLAGTGSARLPRDPRVVELGTLDRPAVSALLSTVRAVALPSLPSLRPEGAPLALVEALAHGRPLLVSDDPGSVELTRGGSAGLVVPAGDRDALQQAVGRLLDDDDLVTWLAAGARAAAADHTPEAGLAQVRAAYRRAGACG